MEQKFGILSLIGRPNAGKSSLLNRMMQTSLALVNAKAQTTRHLTVGIFNDPNQGQMIILDSPGIHEAKEESLNAYMLEQAMDGIRKAQCLWYLVDPFSHLECESKVIATLRQCWKGAPLALIFTKSDHLKRLSSDSRGKATLERFQRMQKDLEHQLIEMIGEKNFLGSIHIANEPLSLHDPIPASLEGLLKKTWSLMKEGNLRFSDPDQLSVQPIEFFAAEFIRGEILTQLSEELPYSCAVKIDSFKEEEKITRIQARIITERESQKGIVIGKKGAQIKSIGEKSRARIEHFLGTKIFLGLTVDVYRNWSRDERFLKELGYQKSRFCI